MFLLKCKCGSIFTLKADKDRRRYNTKCPDCSAVIQFNTFSSMETKEEWSKELDSVTCIPDNAKITVTFDT